MITHRKAENQPEISFYSGKLSELIENLKEQEGKNIWRCGDCSVINQRGYD